MPHLYAASCPRQTPAPAQPQARPPCTAIILGFCVLLAPPSPRPRPGPGGAGVIFRAAIAPLAAAPATAARHLERYMTDRAHAAPPLHASTRPSGSAGCASSTEPGRRGTRRISTPRRRAASTTSCSTTAAVSALAAGPRSGSSRKRSAHAVRAHHPRPATRAPPRGSTHARHGHARRAARAIDEARKAAAPAQRGTASGTRTVASAVRPAGPRTTTARGRTSRVVAYRANILDGLRDTLRRWHGFRRLRPALHLVDRRPLQARGLGARRLRRPSASSSSASEPDPSSAIPSAPPAWPRTSPRTIPTRQYAPSPSASSPGAGRNAQAARGWASATTGRPRSRR